MTLTPGFVGALTSNTVTNSSGSTSDPTLDFGFVFPPTAVRLDKFEAFTDGGSVELKWSTGEESGNLGFNVYRESNGERQLLNRAPIAGKVVKVEMFQGKKAPATSNEASQTNERNAMTIEGEKMTVVCTQIVGIVARRIVCWRKAGDSVELGEKYGLIKFGSRTDLLMPVNVEILVKVGDRVVGGETIIGKLKE